MKLLTAESQKLAANFALSQIGKDLPVIFEQEHNGILSGWSDNYLSVCVPAGSYKPGMIIKIAGNEKNLAGNLKNHHSGSML